MREGIRSSERRRRRREKNKTSRKKKVSIKEEKTGERGLRGEKKQNWQPGGGQKKKGGVRWGWPSRT